MWQQRTQIGKHIYSLNQPAQGAISSFNMRKPQLQPHITTQNLSTEKHKSDAIDFSKANSLCLSVSSASFPNIPPYESNSSPRTNPTSTPQQKKNKIKKYKSNFDLGLTTTKPLDNKTSEWQPQPNQLNLKTWYKKVCSLPVCLLTPLVDLIPTYASKSDITDYRHSSRRRRRSRCSLIRGPRPWNRIDVL